MKSFFQKTLPGRARCPPEHHQSGALLPVRQPQQELLFSLPLCKTSLLRIQSAAVPSCIDCVYAMTFSSGALPVQAQYCETELREEQGYNP